MARTRPATKLPKRRFDLIQGGRRESDVRRAQEARRRLQPRHERFAHLKRVYD